MVEPIKLFIECLLPITQCNIKCHYCYVVQRDNRLMKKAELKYPVSTIAKALRKSRLGGAAYISICGAGETMLQPELPHLVKSLLEEGHYVNITTNGTIKRAFQKIEELITPPHLFRLNFSFSLHYIELKKKGLLDKFFDNVDFVRNLGCSFVVQMNLCDEYFPLFNEIKDICLQRIGALPQLAATRDEINLHSDIRLFTKYDIDTYKQMGEAFDSPLFRFTMNNFMVKRKEFCYAGKWSYVLDLSTGVLKPCYASLLRQNIFEDTDAPIKFTAVGCHCHSPFCMNSSHFISMGVIPSLECDSYAELRNRVRSDGTEWYNPTMKKVLSSKLFENNSGGVDIWKIRKQAFKEGLYQMMASMLSDKMRRKIKKTLLR